MSSSSSSSTSALSIILLILSFFLCTNAFSANNKAEMFCSMSFGKLMGGENMTMCKSLRTLGAQFAWKYQNGTNGSFTLDVLFGARLVLEPPGWLAWGVNPDRAEMIGTQAIIAIIPADDPSKMQVKTYAITKETRMGCRLLPSNSLEGVRVVNKSVVHEGVSDMYNMYARLVLNSSLYNASRLNHVWQIGYALEEDMDPQSHPTSLQNVDSTETIDLTSGQAYNMGQSRSYLRAVHGVLNIIGWGTLLPIGVILARYFKVYPCPMKEWYKLHIACQSIGYLVGTAGWALGLWLGHTSRYYTFLTHRIFAIFIFTFTTIQMLALRLKPNDKDEYRKYWNMYHHFLGYGLLVVIFMNIFKGISILKGGMAWRWAYVGILSLLGAIATGFEIFTWIKFFIDKQKKHKEGSEKEKSKTSSEGGGTQRTKTEAPKEGGGGHT